MNRVIKLILQLLLILFLALFFSKYSTEYNEEKATLTEMAIKEYEKDLKEGKEIDSKKYLVEEKDYNNTISKIGRKISFTIEKSFAKGFHYLMKYLDHLQG